LLPGYLWFLTEVIDLKLMKWNPSVYNLILIQSEGYFIGWFESQSTELLLYHSKLNEHSHIYNPFVTNIDGNFTGSLASFRKDDVLLFSPSDPDILGTDGVITVLQVQDFSLVSPDNSTPYCDCFTLVQTSRRLHSKYFSSHTLDARNPGSSTHEFNSVDGDWAVSGLNGSHRCSDVW
jgi:hypothetical protein